MMTMMMMIPYRYVEQFLKFSNKWLK